MIQCDFKMTAEEASGASEEDESDLYGDVQTFWLHDFVVVKQIPPAKESQ